MLRLAALCLLPLAVSAETLDYRAFQSPVKDQGGRGTCTAFAVAAALETFPGFPHDLSEQWLYGLAKTRQGEYITLYTGLSNDKTQLKRLDSEGLRFEDYVPVLKNYGISYEKLAPYNRNKIVVTEEFRRAVPEAQRPGLAGVLYRFTQFGEKDRELLKWLGKFRVVDQEMIDYSAMREKLARQPVALLTEVAKHTERIVAWLREKGPGSKAVPVWYAIDSARWGPYLNTPLVPVLTAADLKTMAKPGGHAVTIVGYTDEPRRFAPTAPPGRYFLIKNSWGPKWGGLGGYGLLGLDYHRLACIQALLVKKVGMRASMTKMSPFDGRKLFEGAFRLKVQPADDGLSLSSWLEEPSEANVAAVRYVVEYKTAAGEHSAVQSPVLRAREDRAALAVDRAFAWLAARDALGRAPNTDVWVLAAYYEPMLGTDLAVRAGRVFKFRYGGTARPARDLVAAERLDAAKTQAMLAKVAHVGPK